MESIALGYLGLPIERIISLKDVNRDNVVAFNRDVIKNLAMYQNSSSDERQVSFERNRVMFNMAGQKNKGTIVISFQ